MENKKYPGVQRRAFYRLAYPPGKEPRIAIHGQEFIVLDLSESGVRFRNPLGIKMPPDLFPATILLHAGDPIKVVGRVVRRSGDQVALHLIRGIPYQVMLTEQMYIRNLTQA